ncbi:MAG: zeta toxin family protein [Acidobacteriota bacterium]
MSGEGCQSFNFQFSDQRTTRTKRLMLRRIHQLAAQNADFAFETTLASRTFVPLLRFWKENGYDVNLLFIWLSSAELAIERVRSRVSAGGHAIDEAVIVRRYRKGLKNLVSLYLPIADKWSVFDNSAREPALIAKRSPGGELMVYDEGVWTRILKEGR